MSAYDPQNIFAKILRGEIPCVKVHEDGKTLAFMDVMPEGEGHVLVIPKEPAENILDLTPWSCLKPVRAIFLMRIPRCSRH